MADTLKGRETRTQGVIADRVFVGGQEADFVFGKGTQIFPNLPVELWGRTASRIVSDANEKWFEMGFRMDAALNGNAASGWTDAGDYFRIEPEWSLDMVNWQAGKFIPAPVPVVDLGDGSFEYWARAVNPQDSAVKSGAIFCSSTATDGDTRNNPFTSLVLAGVTQLLTFPYTMPGDAARLQTDLLAAGWTGATVTASAATVWTITIPSINYSSYAQISRVGWPAYTFTDALGNVTTIDGRGFDGSFVDPAGTPIYPRAFGRLKITGGSRYNPYL